jgi:hypothetical protein
MTIILIMLIQALPVIVLGAIFKKRVYTTLTAVFMSLLAIATGRTDFLLIDLFGIWVAYWIALSFEPKKLPDMVAKHVGTSADLMVSDDCFLQALQEFDAQLTDDASMARALVDARGDAAAVKSRYLHYRANALQRSQDAQAAEERRMAAAAQAEIEQQKAKAHQEALDAENRRLMLEARRRKDSLARFHESFPSSTRLNPETHASIFEFFDNNQNQTDEVARRVEDARALERRLETKSWIRASVVIFGLIGLVVYVAFAFPGKTIEPDPQVANTAQQTTPSANRTTTHTEQQTATGTEQAGSSIPDLRTAEGIKEFVRAVFSDDEVLQLKRQAEDGDDLANIQYAMILFAGHRSAGEVAKGRNC